jgi:hypothetical protein
MDLLGGMIRNCEKEEKKIYKEKKIVIKFSIYLGIDLFSFFSYVLKEKKLYYLRCNWAFPRT